VLASVEALGRCDPPPLTSVLLRCSDPRVHTELHRRLSAARGPRTGTAWQNFHDDFLSARGLSRSMTMPDADVQRSPWYPILLPREQECLGYGLQHARKQQYQLVGINVSQRLDRLGYCRDGVLSTITPGGKIWLRAEHLHQPATHDRLLLGYEALRAQGFPCEWLSTVPRSEQPSDALMMDLAGNAFPASILGAIFVAMFVHMTSLNS